MIFFIALFLLPDLVGEKRGYGWFFQPRLPPIKNVEEILHDFFKVLLDRIHKEIGDFVLK